MNLILTRNDFLSSGIFGTLTDEYDSFELQTLEHAYEVVPDPTSLSTTYAPKVPNGAYLCVRGMHTLEHHPEPFEAFEITNVPNHTKCLLHVGNYNSDSSGCVLVGLARIGNTEINQSAAAFSLLMLKQDGVDEFTLTVS